MAVVFRNGAYSDYDASKMRAAEPAVVLSGDPDTADGKSVRVAFGGGSDKRLLTEDDLPSGGASHVGMIIHTTTLDTMAKVIAVYGGTTWIQHSGYMLRGATSGVTSNNAVSDGGEATHTLTVDEMPQHTHTQEQHRHNLGERSVYAGSGAAVALVTYGAGSDNNAVSGYTTATNNNTGGGQAHNNMPPYKNVYIWERTA